MNIRMQLPNLWRSLNVICKYKTREVALDFTILHPSIMLTDSEFKGIEDLIEKNKSNLENVRRVMINPSRCLRLYRGKTSRPDMNKMISELTLDRGKILDIITKLKFLVNEIVQTKIVGYDLPGSYLLDSILDKTQVPSNDSRGTSSMETPL